MEPGAPNPYLPPEADLSKPDGAGADAPPLPPVPFEDEASEPSFGARLFATLKFGYTDVFGLADRIPVTAGLLPAWLFHLIVGLPFALIGFAVNSALQGALAQFSGAPPQNNTLMQVGSLVLSLTVGIFVSGALFHALLWMFGGTRHKLGLGQTIRATGYGMALFAPVGWIPVLGGLCALVWLVFFGMGLARVHRTETWRGVCAALALLVVGCCIAGIVIAVMVGRGMAGREF